MPMKQQIVNSLGVAYVRDTVMPFADGSMTREQAMDSLGVVFMNNPRINRR